MSVDKSIIASLSIDLKSIFGNIEWNLGALAGIASIIRQPNMLFLQNIPLRAVIDGLNIDFFQALGIALLEKDRSARSDELIAAAKRALICESIEATAEYTNRIAQVIYTGNDPYNEEDYYSVDFTSLWNTNKGRPGYFFEPEERRFIKDLIVPLRHAVSHNNGQLTPKKFIRYAGVVSGYAFSFDYQWVAGGNNHISMRLELAWNIFDALRQSALRALDKMTLSSP